jgi:PAS domain S-box-containing protein
MARRGVRAYVQHSLEHFLISAPSAKTMLPAELVRSVLDSAPDAMIIIDPSGTVLFASQQITALFGYTPEKVVGRSVEMLMPERYRDRHVAHRARFAQAGHLRPMGIGLELFALREDGTEFPVEISLSPIEHDGQRYIAAAIRDVTERKKFERAIKEARAEAERANLAKSRFLATASHDLRQPLQTLGLLNGTLRRLITDGEALEALEQQELALRAMSRLLNTLLDISKLESGAVRPDITDFEVSRLIEELRAEFAELARSKGLELRTEISAVSVHSDPSLVGQILRNLLSNAIKYTNTGVIALRCEADAGAVRIDVQDSGIGIPEEQLDLIYDEFYQVSHPANSSRDGYGLGLSIVQRLVRLLGLQINVQSQVGRGSTFSLRLPKGNGLASRPDAAASVSPPPRNNAGPQRHILLVEDDPGVRNATRLFLKGEGYRVTATASLAEAVEHATHHRDVDVIVSDYHLGGGVTGTDVIASIRKILGNDTRAILVTGDTSSAVRDLHCDARLRVTSKPVNADELAATLRDLLAS